MIEQYLNEIEVAFRYLGYYVLLMVALYNIDFKQEKE